MQAIRNFPQEPLLREQGFKPSYYAGVDQAREVNRLHEYLREIQADPKRTHIPYFADQVERTISDFERGLRKQKNIAEDPEYDIKDPKFQEKRLKILEDFKREARRRVENRDVTYDWWVKFNSRLAVLGSPSELGSLSSYSVERIKMGYGSESVSLSSFYNDKEFPEKMMFFTTGELGIMAFNTLGNNSHFISLSGDLENMAHGFKMSPYNYLLHDAGHMAASVGLPKGVLDRVRVNNISNKSDREKVELALFIYRHENGGRNNDHSQSALEEMMSVRLFDPNDLQGLLPDGMNVTDEPEVKSFLKKSATVFGAILSDLN